MSTETSSIWVHIETLLAAPGRLELFLALGLTMFVVVILALVLVLREVRHLRTG
ncbi:hypothetical protein [Tropicibacter alexandrii]|uniref:hypothetical protein n=1 Tax=Tropicibacter alexandrii TaxID=2267683 RepID=UPI0013E8DC98|nr:hypothetical protein [Tropicibacter alexandrii]